MCMYDKIPNEHVYWVASNNCVAGSVYGYAGK